jgi:two-component system NtrC family response regulator
MFLIIDDDLAIRTSLRLLLKQAGYLAQAVATPAEALAVVRETPPRLVLMDMNYSLDTTGADGLALLRQVKAVAPQVPVILITGWGSIALAVEGMKAGAAEFITKPWHNDGLLQTMRTVLAVHENPPDAEPTEAPARQRRQLDQQFAFKEILARMRSCSTCCARWARWPPPTPPSSSKATAALARNSSPKPSTATASEKTRLS